MAVLWLDRSQSEVIDRLLRDAAWHSRIASWNMDAV